MNTKPILYGSMIIGASMLLSVAAMIGVAMRFLDTYEKRIADQARYECALSWRVEVKESDKILGIYPAERGYEKCLREKGL